MTENIAHDVLIVDDSPAMRRFVKRVLSISGFPIGECNEAGDGVEALDLLSRHHVDLILTDINMPRMDGEEFMTRVAAEERTSSIPVVVISTDATHNRADRMMALGASGYIAKPFSPEALRSKLEEVMCQEEV
jgi:two-component system chemotaxis response regulator CheY